MAVPADSRWRNPNLLDEDEDTSHDQVTQTRDLSNFAPAIESLRNKNPGTPVVRQRSPSPDFSDEDPPFNFGSRDHRQQVRPNNENALSSKQSSLADNSGSLVAVGGSSRVVIAIDYGTTYTGLAVASTQSGHAKIDEIEVLQNWGSNGNNQSKVRTMISYVKSATGKTQWGSAVSHHATAMVNTKLELEPQASRYDELELTLYVLMGTGNLAFEHLKKIGPDPAYTSAPPRQIVQDYLGHICESALSERVFKKVDFSKLAGTKTPVDIVVTVPAKWSMEATDATFKAVRGAGFNKKNFPTLKDTILITEPEAASFFAIRDHQAASDIDLRVDDCFIICDAGGGTVDVVACQVKKVKPYLEIEMVTEADSRKCGSAFVDTAFKNWLRDTLGVEDYGKLDPENTQGRITTHNMESKPIRDLVRDFITKKHDFSNESSDILLDMPEPLKGMEKPGRVREGELTIYHDEMENLFDDCINGVIELLKSQIKKLKVARNRKARNVFLVGGFGASLYLQHHLEETLGLQKGAVLRRPASDKSLTAVVQGAVIYGVEKSLHSVVKYMSAVKDSFAICINNQFEWLIKSGDLILSTEKRSFFSKDFSKSLKSCPMRKFVVSIYKYTKRHEDDDDRPDWWEDGQHEVEKVALVKCDVSAMLDHDMRIPPNQQRQGNLEIGPFRCRFLLSTSSLDVEVLHKKKVLARSVIQIRTDAEHNPVRNTWT